MNWKKLLAIVVLLLGAAQASAQPNSQQAVNFGWIPTPEATEQYVQSLPQVYGTQVHDLIVADDNADALLYKALIPCLQESGRLSWIKQRGQYQVVRAYNQGNVGSCVGNATAACLSILNAVEVWLLKEDQEFTAMHSADGTYGLCREAANMLGNRGDGCSGSGAAKAITNFGTLYQLKYGNADLTQNDPNRARQMGYSGVGNALKAEAVQRKCGSAVRVKSAQEAWSLIGNGYPINVCSGQGFSKQRDSEGVCRPSGGWNHSMAVIGRRTTSDGRKLFLIWNSWGDNWASGPYWQDMPEGSFWIEWKVMDSMLSRGDSFAYGTLDGFRGRDLDGLGTKDYLGINLNHNGGQNHATNRIRSGGVWARAGRTGIARISEQNHTAAITFGKP